MLVTTDNVPPVKLEETQFVSVTEEFTVHCNSARLQKLYFDCQTRQFVLKIRPSAWQLDMVWYTVISWDEAQEIAAQEKGLTPKTREAAQRAADLRSAELDEEYAHKMRACIENNSMGFSLYPQFYRTLALRGIVPPVEALSGASAPL